MIDISLLVILVMHIIYTEWRLSVIEDDMDEMEDCVRTNCRVLDKRIREVENTAVNALAKYVDTKMEDE